MKSLLQFFFKLGSPHWFYRNTRFLLPILALAALGLLAWGLVEGLLYAPMDAKQKNSFRIIYIHVPAAILAQSAYAMMAIAGAIFLIWRMKMAAWVAASIASRRP